MRKIAFWFLVATAIGLSVEYVGFHILAAKTMGLF